MEKPVKLIDKHLVYLDELRESGVTNMWGAGEYLNSSFPDLTEKMSTDILFYWMKTFSVRHHLQHN